MFRGRAFRFVDTMLSPSGAQSEAASHDTNWAIIPSAEPDDDAEGATDAMNIHEITHSQATLDAHTAMLHSLNVRSSS